jgi:cell division protein ZapA (FtsZ GTPase activity inhibitor)
MATASKQPPTDASPSANGSVRVEIFDQVYNLRGSDADYILKLAEYVDGKMRAVSQQTATVDSVRLAVLAALNIADEYHLLKRRLEKSSPEAQQRAGQPLKGISSLEIMVPLRRYPDPKRGTRIEY